MINLLTIQIHPILAMFTIMAEINLIIGMVA